MFDEKQYKERTDGLIQELQTILQKNNQPGLVVIGTKQFECFFDIIKRNRDAILYLLEGKKR